MSLDDLTLSPFLVKKMYEHFLIDTQPAKAESPTPADPSPKPAIKAKQKAPAVAGIRSLGNNTKNILILIDEKEHAFLSDTDLNFLINILNACKISVEDTALVNCCGNEDAVYEKLLAQFSPAIILFLGTEPHLREFPVQIPRYRIQQYDNRHYLSAPSLKELAADKEEKKQLWNVLKVLFAV